MEHYPFNPRQVVCQIGLLAAIVFFGVDPRKASSSSPAFDVEAQPEIEGIDFGQLIELTSMSRVKIFDVRSEMEYQNGHIAGAERFENNSGAESASAVAVIVYGSRDQPAPTVEAANNLAQQSHRRVFYFPAGYEKWASLRKSIKEGPKNE